MAFKGSRMVPPTQPDRALRHLLQRRQGFIELPEKRLDANPRQMGSQGMDEGDPIAEKRRTDGADSAIESPNAVLRLLFDLLPQVLADQRQANHPEHLIHGKAQRPPPIRRLIPSWKMSE